MTDQLTTHNPHHSYTETMGRDPFAPDTPEPQNVLDALDDPTCHGILEELEHPMTASELSEVCDIPESTMYRKLDLLSDASLIEEQIEIRADGRHTTRYALNFEEVRVSLDDTRALDIAIKRRSQTPEERLSELWSEVSKEA